MIEKHEVEASTPFGNEAAAGSAERFGFGENWRRFLAVLNEDRIREAERSIIEMLAAEDLFGRSFLDAGCGSGLFSLAAMNLGAERVHSFDYDSSSVACAQVLKDRYYPDDDRWTIEQGSVLDKDYVAELGRFDVVYSWGVLHHTGDLWTGLERVRALARPGGLLFLSIYNDQGPWSGIWRRVKRLYNMLPPVLRPAYVAAVLVPVEARYATYCLLSGQPRAYIRSWRNYQRNRGMSRWRDYVDWVGGYPFEVAKPEAVFDDFRDNGCSLVALKTCAGGLGCNEYVFAKSTSA